MKNDVLKVSFYIVRKWYEFLRAVEGNNISAHYNRAIEWYVSFRHTVYIITNKKEKTAFVGVFEGFETHDVYYHYVKTTGSGTIGDAVRKLGFNDFEFKVLGRFEDRKMANYFKNHIKEKLSKKYTFYKGY